MNATGIIAEFNPLHLGHEYLLKEAHKRTEADAVVVAMSGNFVQRGGTAVFDKWERADHALSSGADLVIEIPTLWCVSDAKHYARGGVKLLESLGTVDSLVFGSECGDESRLINIANNIKDNSEYFESTISKFATVGLSYPRARQKAYELIFGYTPTELTSPNDILGIEYILACNKLKPLVIKRLGAGYSDTDIGGAGYKSASGIRAALLQGEDVSRMVPDICYNWEEALLTCDSLFDMLRILIINMDAAAIDECPSGGEGIGNRLKEVVRTSSDYNNLIETTKSKRYTYTRIARLLIQILLGINRIKYPYYDVPYLRILGFNDKGRELISYSRKNELNTKPFITNVNKNIKELDVYGQSILKLDIKASDIYNLIRHKDIVKYSDNSRTPIIK